ncbi:conserved hypothetical protein [Uncinocarpus reesii 1704]|uniref:BTB domain-containing protein n=1 Tax=Uncinocarpus reesii (strain UAMH 1704) TaxID=336963 RepID=C4JF08_UNCRE|nr:uncharacterized protein UREG_00909 [Uncinocarpus reesii 1704]EEP76061.1 conserved hypothetical protein [Uncinocarpus reesii 1704]
MAEPRVEIEVGGSKDVEMTGASETPAPQSQPADDAEPAADPAPTEENDATAKSPENSKENQFLDYLKSPIVELVVGKGEEQTVLTAHQAILTLSPYFAEEVSKFPEDGPRRIFLEDESIDTVGCFLQYQYTGEYFPKRLAAPSEGLETDPAIPEVDETGQQLLKHARVYTLAEKLGINKLKSLAHGKIHRIHSTAKGEIEYAKYVYTHTKADDTIRKPVAAFWATRSHVLRHEAEADFRTLCLQYPQFGFDVLSLVLDQREKRAQDRETASPAVKGSARKRARML